MKLNFGMVKTGAQMTMRFLSKHSPTICVAIGTGLMTGAIVKTVVEAPKAKEEIEILDSAENVPPKKYIQEKARIIFYHYWMVAGMTLGGAALIFWGHKVSLGRTAAALAAYQMSKDDLKKLEDKIVEMDGEKHLEKAKDSINKDKATKNPFNNNLIINTGNGNTLFFDPVGNTYFLSDYEFIRQAKEDANCDLSELMGKKKRAVLSYDGWREYLGLPPIDGRLDGRKFGPSYGKNLGWINRKIGLKFTSILLDDDTHCEVLDYTKSGEPKWHIGLEDEYYDDYDYDDDSTDMSMRGD